MIHIRSVGSFKNTESFLKRMIKSDHREILHRYGKQGVDALRAATPVDTGLTADSWSYAVSVSKHRLELKWYNSNTTKNGVPIVILLQYGHGTKGGRFVSGTDFINPAIVPIFKKLSEEIWREVTR